MQEEQHDNLQVDHNLADGNENTQEQNTTNQAIEAIENLNAEANEDASAELNHEIPTQDYESMDMETLVIELEHLVALDKITAIKDHVEEIKHAFISKYNHFIEEKREEFHRENPTEDFEYHLPLKSKFDTLYSNYKAKKNSHFKNIENTLKANLQKRLQLIEDLKNLVANTDNIPDALKQINEIREQWKSAGAIPKDKYNHVWNNYHFHIENFYDILHLDREARDLDFKHNLEQKQKLILRAKDLLNNQDVFSAFRELQSLHKIWKEEIGPVSKEHRETVWKEFSDITKQMHDKREEMFSQYREIENQNLAKKQSLINEIEAVAKVHVEAHSEWQGLINKVEALRQEFFATGKVPAENNEQTWADFKTAVRNFNVHKNSFYKDIKKEQQTNLDKKNALVARAKSLQDNTDFAATTPIMKQIQEEWRTIGHVPKKFSDVVWGEFKAACNHYFDRLHEHRNANESVEVEAFEKKKDYLETIKSFELTGNHKTDLDAIKAHIETWKSFGKVPFARRHIEGKFNKILDALFEKLTSSKKDAEMMRFNNRIEQLGNDTKRLDGEKIFIQRKIEEVKNEIFQLENNIQFFANAKNDNPMIIEVRKSIERHKEELETWKDKLKQLRNM